MIKITAICENTVFHKKCWAEEGLSILIEIDTPQPLEILYDCGRSGTVLEHNLDILGVELDSIDYLVLSHGHSGHIGGLEKIVKKLTKACIVLHPNIFIQKLKRNSTELRSSGNQPLLKELVSQKNKKISQKPTKISDYIVISGEIPLTESRYDKNDRYFVRMNNNVKPDLFNEELAIGIKTNKGVVVITACSHRGIVNIVKHMTSLFNDTPLYGIIGGIHLFDDLALTRKVIEDLKILGVNLIAPCHCTGILSEALIYEAFPGQFYNFHTGNSITIIE